MSVSGYTNCVCRCLHRCTPSTYEANFEFRAESKCRCAAWNSFTCSEASENTFSPPASPEKNRRRRNYGRRACISTLSHEPHVPFRKHVTLLYIWQNRFAFFCFVRPTHARSTFPKSIWEQGELEDEPAAGGAGALELADPDDESVVEGGADGEGDGDGEGEDDGNDDEGEVGRS